MKEIDLWNDDGGKIIEIIEKEEKISPLQFMTDFYKNLTPEEIEAWKKRWMELDKKRLEELEKERELNESNYFSCSCGECFCPYCGKMLD